MTMNDSNRWLWLAGLLLCIWLVYLLTPILTPFLIGVLLAYLGDPLVDRLERWGCHAHGASLPYSRCSACFCWCCC